MPRLSLRPYWTKPPEPALPVPLIDILNEAGAYAKCRATHVGYAGWQERGVIRALDHEAVQAEPQYFDVIVRANRLLEVANARE